MVEDGRMSLRIRLGEVEVEVQGTWDEIIKAWKDLPDFVKSVDSAAEGTHISWEPEAPGKTEVERDIDGPPFIKDMPKTLKEIVLAFFKTPWGRQPRTVTEVGDALKANGKYYSPSSVSTTLIRHVRNGKLRRLSKRGRWAYVAP